MAAQKNIIPAVLKGKLRRQGGGTIPLLSDGGGGATFFWASYLCFCNKNTNQLYPPGGVWGFAKPVSGRTQIVTN